MKRKQRPSAAAADAEDDEPSQPTLVLDSFSGDVCAALTARYGRSTAPQHRHLLASAAAIHSILLDDGLPLTPASFLPAIVSALQAAGAADPDAASALASLLVILLPHIPCSPSSLQPVAASKSASALAAFLSSPDASQLPTGTLRSVVKSLGHLALHLDAAAHWDAVVPPLEALLAASVDNRAKVRKCAQESVEKLFSYLEESGCAKKASNAAVAMFEKHISLAQSLINVESDFFEGEEAEAGHMLGAMVVLAPYLSKKAKMRVFSDAYKLLSTCFTPLTRHALKLLGILLDHLKAQNVESEVESLVSLVMAYLPYDEKKPDDTIVSALHLFKSCLAKLAGQPKFWVKTLPAVFEAVSGESSYVFMKDILLTLSQYVMKRDKESHMKNIEECLGAAIFAMGPDKILSLIPVAFDKDMLTCSNIWLLPILDKYTYGAPLQSFLERIVPLARSVQKASKKVKKARIRKDLLSWADQLWSLLPAFCRYPIDLRQSFGSLSKLLVEILKCDEWLHKHAAKALQIFYFVVPQQLVDGTRRLSSDQDVEIYTEISALFSSKPNNFSCARLERCSKKDACKAMKVLGSHSADLLCTFADYFLESSPEKRDHLKDALRCLALLSSSTNIRELFVSLVKRFDLEDAPLDPESIECQTHNVDENDKQSIDAAEMLNDKRSILLEFISTLVEAADEDLLDIFFGFIKSSLLNSSGSCDSKALISLSIILKEHNGYSLAHLDEILMLLHGVKPDSDNAVLESKLLCYQYLLVHMIKVNEESTNKKAFLIINELILGLKTKKESRRFSYDVLLAISSSLRSSKSNSANSDLQRLFTMVMGYLSSPSPHIVSGAIAALSLLIYNDANFCMEVPNLIESVLVLLQHKAVEVTKASLGFVKVLVTSLQSEKLLNLQADILKGILEWSSVTKHHFKGKVSIIVPVNLNTPEKYKPFIRSVEEGRKGNHNQAEGAESKAQDHERHDAKRRRRVHPNAESGQETPGRPMPKGQSAGKKQAKDFHFKKGAARDNSHVPQSQQSKASGGKGDMPNFKSKSKWQPGNGQRNRGDKSLGSNKRARNGTFSKTQDRGNRASVQSRSFKKRKSGATT
ncbi:hypothetical protein PR202_gb03696 [Eleusine coracana subsp. coracana]|uniref:Ribosomal RNA-processing protein 12-like conserved domain-containing protein n=1 Tax=Eleusine coracana subsp. coracana TaxID=191504 RepID=A0AAV5E047_ELECO|nr:hypothetical protein PR202_gb03696 [Eleusine coracana subsp. coracana]